MESAFGEWRHPGCKSVMASYGVIGNNLHTIAFLNLGILIHSLSLTEVYKTADLAVTCNRRVR